MPGQIKSRRFREFMKSMDTFRVYKGRLLVFSSNKDRLIPIIDYIDRNAPYPEGVTVYDRIIGNAAALLLIKIKCRIVFSQLGSENAVRTLESHGIKYRFNETVDCIMDDSGQDMCPMERMSLGKNSGELLEALRQRIGGSSG